MRQATLSVVAGGALFLLLFALGEAAVRVFGDSPEASESAGEWTDFAEAFAGSPELGWVRRPGFEGSFEDGYRRSFDGEGFYDFDSAQARDPRKPKVLFIGGSVSYGYGVPAERTLVEVLERELPGVAAISAGVPGYTSAQGVIVAERLIPRLRPRVAVITFNFNDRRYVRRRDVDGRARFLDIYRGSPDYLPNRLLRGSRLAQAIRGRLSPPSTGFSLARAVPRVGANAYRRNLERIAALCESYGVKPVFLALPDDPGRTRPLREAVAADERGGSMAALAELERVVAEHRTGGAVARRRLARLYRRLNRDREADEVLNAGSADLSIDGGEPLRRDSVYIAEMRKAAERTGATLVDASGLLVATQGAYIDDAHLSVRGHQVVGELLAGRLEPLVAQ